MKKSLSYILLALAIFSMNALPAQGAKKKQKFQKAENQLVSNPGQWCFELPHMGIFCYEL